MKTILDDSELAEASKSRRTVSVCAALKRRSGVARPIKVNDPQANGKGPQLRKRKIAYGRSRKKKLLDMKRRTHAARAAAERLN